MTKIELTLSSDYVPTWTVVDAVRELFQNALDQEKVSSDNRMDWEYDEENETLYITSYKSALSTRSLLLGYTTKAGDTSAIGQFGEGYKLAALVLTRLGKELRIRNNDELWTSAFVKSRRFGANVLTFYIEDTDIKIDGITFEIRGITAEEWHEQIVPSNLMLQSDYEILLENNVGKILSSPQHQGMVFIEGLFICKYGKYKYGYSFNADYVNLDRDRKLMSDFDLQWLSSKAWKSDLAVIDLLAQDVADVEYIINTADDSSGLALAAHENFRNTYGDKAVPVSYQEEIERVPAGYKGIVVPTAYKILIKSAQTWENPPAEPTALQIWWDTYKHYLPEEAQEEFLDIAEVK